MKFRKFYVLPLALVVLGLLSFANNAYAIEPEITSFTLENLDRSSSPVVSDGDTITIVFNVETDRGGFALNVPINMTNVDSLFSISEVIGADYDGQWISNSAFVITLIDTTGQDITEGSTSVEPDTIPIADAAAPLDIWTLESPPIQILSKSNGDGCNAECEHPTLGVDKKGNRLVEDGFSYNGNPIDAELYFTPYPQIKTTTGVLNTAKLKIYDNGGPENIRHVELAFGLAKDQTINQRTASIFWDRHFDGTEIVSVKSPTNAIGHVKVESDIHSCKSDSNEQCLVLIIEHRFRAPLEFDIVGTNIWDEDRSAWQNYFNHGVHVEGESQNPDPQHFGIHKGHLIKITETDRNVGVDADGNVWIFNKIWNMVTPTKEKIDDGLTSHGFDRNSARFNTYKQGQELLAQSILDDMFRENISSFLSEPKSHEFEFVKRSDNPELQKRILEEKKRAYDLFFELYDLEYNH